MAIVIDLFNTFLFHTKSIVSGAYIFIFDHKQPKSMKLFKIGVLVHVQICISLYIIFFIFFIEKVCNQISRVCDNTICIFIYIFWYVKNLTICCQICYKEES